MKKTVFIISVTALVAAMALWAPERASAFMTWSADNTTNTGNCAGCHGDFQANGYVSQQDGTPWNDSLMDGHGNGPAGMGIACTVCHTAGFGAVMLNPDPATGAGGCVSCHGRAEDGLDNIGAGLRAHHAANGVTVCAGCHADPAVLVGEDVLPPRYSSLGWDPCADAQFGPTGLDNDGDNLYDDSDCGPIDLCAGNSCDDGNACNGTETCDPADGSCILGTDLVCDDGDVCNGTETCDPTTGCQGGTPLLCDDGDACNGVETCDATTGCQGGTALDCDDLSPCTNDSCDPIAACVNDPISCPTGQSCNPATGGCIADDLCAGNTCDDGDACNGIETCNPADGSCIAGTPLVCDDGDACNGVESCDAVAGCQSGTPLVCDDGDACNGLETCDAVAGCQSGAPLSCDNGVFCDGTETCDAASGCVAGTSPCAGSCDEGSDTCLATGECTMDSDCPAGEICDDTGTCLSAPPPAGGTNHLATTCLGCHGDRSASASCATGTKHVARVGQQVWDETLVELGLTCDDGTPPDGGTPPADGPPADHTDREDGFMHKPGKDRPFTNGCTSCHGENLVGGFGPSCYTCHGQEWDERGPSTDPGSGSDFNPPADHTDREDGFMHKPGKDRPFTNDCTMCHGADLRGGFGPSCYTCHGQEWDERGPSTDAGSGTDFNPPADHTDREDGFMHKPGKDRPFTNGCTSCHGENLMGGFGPSCYTCHGQEWDERGSGMVGDDVDSSSDDDSSD